MWLHVVKKKWSMISSGQIQSDIASQFVKISVSNSQLNTKKCALFLWCMVNWSFIIFGNKTWDRQCRRWRVELCHDLKPKNSQFSFDVEYFWRRYVKYHMSDTHHNVELQYKFAFIWWPTVVFWISHNKLS